MPKSSSLNRVAVAPVRQSHWLLRAFDWRAAVAELSAATPAPLRAFDGVRVVCILGIVLGHTVAFDEAGF